jgi:hypothetical protein
MAVHSQSVHDEKQDGCEELKEGIDNSSEATGIA